MSTLPRPRFYVYLLVRPNGKPFYVGKGSGLRVFKHDQEARRGCKCHKCNVIRKIWRSGKQVQRYIVFETHDEQEAFEYEREQIALFGRENLANGTDGGDGPAGAKRSEETRRRMGESSKRAWQDPEGYARRCEAMMPNLEAAWEGSRRRWEDPEEHARQSQVAHEKLRTPEVQERARATLRKVKQSEEGRARAREGAKKRWANPENREKHRLGIAAYWARKKAERDELD